MRTFLITTLALCFVGRASAQTIDATEYLPLGQFNAWHFVQSDDPDDTITAKTFRTDLVGQRLEYRVRSPFIDSLKDVRLTLAVEDGELLLVRIFFQDEQTLDLDDDIDSVFLNAITFDPPLVLGDDSTTVNVDNFVNDVDTTFTARIKVGPFRETVTVNLTGTITSSWLSPEQYPNDGDNLSFPVGDSANRVDWRMLFALNLEASADGETVEAVYANTTDVMLGEGLGPLIVTDPKSSLHVLDGTIASGTTEGAIFDAAPELLPGIDSVSFDSTGLFFYEDGVDAPTPISDANLVLDELRLYHELNGRAVLTGMASSPEEGSPSYPFTLKGKIRPNAKKQTAKLSLKGKLKDMFAKPLTLKAGATLLPGASSFPIKYKIDKETFGELMIPIESESADSVEFSTGSLADISFKVKKARKLGVTGTLNVGSASYDITWRETRKSPIGKPTKHNYSLFQTGVKGRLMRAGALTPVDEEGTLLEEDYLLSKFKAKLFGGFGIKVTKDELEEKVAFEIE